MAEGWARLLFPADWSVASCGLVTHPIAAETRQVMQEVGADLAGQASKSLDAVDLDTFDLVVTLSRTAARYLPRLRRPERHVRAPVADPMAARGTDAEVLAAFRASRDRIREVVEDVIAGRLQSPGRDPAAG
jgi:arsenate reductase